MSLRETHWGAEDKVPLGPGHFLRCFRTLDVAQRESQWVALDVWSAMRDTLDTSKMNKEDKKKARHLCMFEVIFCE